MPKKRTLRRPLIEPVLLFTAALVFFAGRGFGAPSYAAKGMVLTVDKLHRRVLISCQSIPGYMPATVVHFSVHEPTDLENLSPGTIIDFTLVADKKSPYAENIRIHEFETMEQDPLNAHRLNLLNTIVDPAAQPNTIRVGQHVPDFALIDQDRQRVTLSEFAGKVVAITFIYTQCPLPNFCFRLTNNFGLLQKRFSGEMGRDLVLLSVTFDPQHDSPEVLAKYGEIWKANPQGWHLLTGPQPEIEKFCHQLGMNFWPDEGIMAHSLHTVILDRHGMLVANLEGNEFTADQLGDLVQSMMGNATNE